MCVSHRLGGGAGGRGGKAGPAGIEQQLGEPALCGGDSSYLPRLSPRGTGAAHAGRTALHPAHLRGAHLLLSLKPGRTHFPAPARTHLAPTSSLGRQFKNNLGTCSRWPFEGAHRHSHGPSRSRENSPCVWAAPGDLRRGPVSTPSCKQTRAGSQRGVPLTVGQWPLQAERASSGRWGPRISQGRRGFRPAASGAFQISTLPFYFLSWT